uniref:ULP_PROTEASE domain-containing protein n=1 Tax=Globodera pallida TaxID=36090 RepID=A0A183C304_GLOPA
MVLNTDTSQEAGTHWVAVYVAAPHVVDYFDSFADWPPVSAEIGAFLHRFAHVNRSDTCVQSDRSSACGKHVIYFLCRRCSGWPLGQIVRHLTHCKTPPDRLVSAFTRRFIFDEEEDVSRNNQQQHNNNNNNELHKTMHVDFDPLQVDWTTLLGGGGGGFLAPDDNSGTTWEVLSGGGTGATTHCNRTNAPAANTLLMLGSGGGGAAYPVFAGLPYQRGAGGLGSMFRSFLRFLVPIGRQAGAALARQGLESGARVLSNVLDGADLKQSLVTEGRTGLKNLLDKAADSVARSQQQQQQNKREEAAAEILTSSVIANIWSPPPHVQQSQQQQSHRLLRSGPGA